jgi:putative ABC transport system substrate-binding protein
MAYSIYVVDTYRLVATYVDRTLHGAQPADLPVQAPIRYETVFTSKLQRRLGLKSRHRCSSAPTR